MNYLPEPPSVEVLARLEADIHSLDEGALLWRVYFQGGPYPSAWNELRAFGPTASRFDHHLPPPRVQPERGILYTAAHGETCLAEAFQDTRLIDRGRQLPWLVGFALRRPVALLDLTGAWPTRAGASMAIGSGERAMARLWSRAIHAAYPAIDGLLYCSSMDANRPAVALYERAASSLPSEPLFHRALADPALHDLVSQAARRFNYRLA